MAQNTIYLDVVVDDNGTTQRVAVQADRLAAALGRTATGAAQTDRNIKGTAQASSNATKNFSKMSQGMGGLVAAYATIAAQVFALSAAYQFLLQAADFRILIEGQKALTEQTGIGYTSITRSIQAATDAQLGYKQAAQAAAIGTAAGLSATMLKDIASYSQTISAVLGRDLEDTFNRLIRGITKAEPELLDELGIVLRLSDATSEYARTLGKTATELTAYERTQGVAIFTLEQVEQKYGALNKSSELSANGIRQLGAAFSELATKVLPEVAKVAEFLANSIRGNVGAVTATFGLLLAGVIRQALPATEDIVRRSNAALEKYSEKIADYTLKADAFARGQLTITKTVKPAVDSLKSLASGIQRVQGVSASPFLTDIANIGNRFNPKEVISMQDKIEAELTKRQQRGYRGSRRDPLFVGIRDEQLREFSSKLGIMVMEAERATKSIEGKFTILGNKVGETASRIQLRWAQAMRGMQLLSAVAIKGINKLFSALGIIGLFITLWEVLKSVYAWAVDKFGKKDIVEKSLAEQVIGSGEEIDAAKARIQDLERATKGLERIRLKGTFEEVVIFTGNVSSNIKSSIDELKKQNEEYISSFLELQKQFQAIQKVRQEAAEKIATAQATGIAQAGRAETKTNFKTLKQLNTLYDETTSTRNKLDEAAATSRYAIGLELVAYARAIPELQKYEKELYNLIEAREFEKLATSEATRAVVEYATNANQAAGAVKAFAEGFKTLNKEVIDSAQLDSTQKRFLQLNTLLRNLGDAIKYSSKNGTVFGIDLKKVNATAAEFATILEKVKKQLDNTFDLKVQEQNLSRLGSQLQLFSSQPDTAIELLNEQDVRKTQLEIAKIQNSLETLEVNKDLFDVFTGQNQKLIAAALADAQGTSILAAGATNADKLAEKFTESSDGFISKYKAENDSFFTRLAKVRGTEAPIREKIPEPRKPVATAQEVSTPENAIQEITITATRYVDPNAERNLRNQELERQKFLLEQQRIELEITQTINNKVQAAKRVNDFKLKELDIARQQSSLELDLLNSNASLEDILFNQNQFALDNLMYNEQQLDIIKTINREAERGIQTEIDSGTATGDRLKNLRLALERLQGINQVQEQTLQLENEKKAIEAEEQPRQTRLKLLSQENDAVKNLLDIQQEYVSLQNPYLQDELSERLNIQKAQQSILYLQQQINETVDQQALPGLQNQLELEEARLFVLQQQSAEINKISQAAQGAFGQGLQQEIANFLKGGELDIENSFLNIIKSVGEAAADQLSQSITESIMGGIFGQKTPEDKMKNGVIEGAIQGAEILRQGVASGVSGIAASAQVPGGVPTADPSVTASRSIGKDLRGFASNVGDIFASDAPFIDKLGSIFNAGAPWINSLTRGLTGALGGLAVGALGGGGGNAWRNAIIGGVVSGLSFGFSSWLGGLGSATPAASGAAANLTPINQGGAASYSSFAGNLMVGANGGVMKGGFRAFASGGVVNKPTFGLIGEGKYNEAVVPLPDGKSIPVIMQSAGGDTNNVGININVTSNGQMQSDAQATGERGVAMAQAIQNVVQMELKRQKRPGGLLSPF